MNSFVKLMVITIITVMMADITATPKQDDFGPYCKRDMKTRGYAFLYQSTNEGKTIAKKETIGLKSKQDVFFISDIGRYNDAMDWKMKPDFGKKITTNYGIRMAGALVACLARKEDAQRFRIALIEDYKTRKKDEFWSNRLHPPKIIEIDMKWPLEKE